MIYKLLKEHKNDQMRCMPKNVQRKCFKRIHTINMFELYHSTKQEVSQTPLYYLRAYWHMTCLILLIHFLLWTITQINLLLLHFTHRVEDKTAALTGEATTLMPPNIVTAMIPEGLALTNTNITAKKWKGLLKMLLYFILLGIFGDTNNK